MFKYSSLLVHRRVRFILFKIQLLILNENLIKKLEMQKITKGKVSFIFFLLVLTNLTLTNINFRTSESDNLPTINSLSSEYAFEWNATLGGIYIDGARGVAVDNNDNVYIAGYQDFSGSNTNRDFAIAKYNPIGEQQWVRYWGGNNDDIPYDIIIDSFDNIFIVGLTESFGDINGDAVIVKFNITGHQQWNFTWGGNQFDAAIAIDIDSANNFYIGGNSNSFGDIDGNAFLVKFNSNWIEQWNESWGGSDFEDVGYIHIDSNDDIFISGRSDSLDPSPGEGDAFLNKYNSSGNLQWSRNWGSSYSQMASGIATDSLDDVYIVCMTFGHPASSGKGAIVKYSSEGTYQWEEIWGVNGVYSNYMYRIIIDSNDDLYISGTTRSYGLPNNNDAILFNYDTVGNQNWYKVWSEYEWDLSFGLCMDSQSNIYLVGDTKSYSIGQNDILLLKYAFLSNIPYIDIISPENITYTEPMSGYYPATFGFENCKDGELPYDWSFVPHHDYGEAYVVNNIDGHNKILKIEDTYHLAYPEAFQEFNPQTIGTIELYLRKESGASGFYLNFYDNLGVIAFNIKMDQDNNGKFEIGLVNDFTEFARGKYSDQTWFHFRIDFNAYTDEATIFLDGIIVIQIEFSNFVENIAKIRLGANYANTGIFYADAIGYSWDENYFVGDNLHEGLLISYSNTTNLFWLGYSLDGSSNITIRGNKVIPFPENGIHSILLSGTTSTGITIKSNLMYFTVITTNPPITPFLPGNPLLIPILLISIGIGVIALISITFIVYRRRTLSQTWPTIITHKEYQIEEKVEARSYQAKFCPFCGNPIMITHKFCITCGTSLKNI